MIGIQNTSNPSSLIDQNGSLTKKSGPFQLAAAASTGAAGSTSSKSSTTDSSEITGSDFLTLLVSELQNQDPTQPTDPQAYVQQLVGVNSLQQLIAINKDLGG